MTASTTRPAADRQGTSPPPRERILAAARELFYRRGIHAVGVEAIAEAAGTNKMTLYRHFASKDVLVAACLSELTQEFDVAWDAIAAAHVGDPRHPTFADFIANPANPELFPEGENPERLDFVPASESATGTALLLVTNETSGQSRAFGLTSK